MITATLTSPSRDALHSNLNILTGCPLGSEMLACLQSIILLIEIFSLIQLEFLYQSQGLVAMTCAMRKKIDQIKLFT